MSPAKQKKLERLLKELFTPELKDSGMQAALDRLAARKAKEQKS